MNSDYSAMPGPHPEGQALRAEIARLRASLTALLLQKDDLLLIQSKRIETAYLRRFGALEVKLYETWCACLRAKKKAKLIRASQNRREQADLQQIEAVLNDELAAYQEQLEDKFRRVAGVLEKHEGPGLSSHGTKELKDLYRQAVKALHPDLHPGQDETETQMLQQAMRAYRSGDLETLRAICDGIGSEEPQEVSALEVLRAEAARLRAGIRSFDRQLEEIKAEYPFSMRVFLENDAQGKAHESELLGKLRELQERTARYEAQIAFMLASEEEEANHP